MPHAGKLSPSGSPPRLPHPASPGGALPPAGCIPSLQAAIARGTTAVLEHETAPVGHLPNGVRAATANNPDLAVPMPTPPARPSLLRSALRTAPAAAVECRTGSAHARRAV